jgi:MOSC domain-containing protein YiiM
LARIESVNVGPKRRIANATGATGIWKVAVAEAMVTADRVAGDFVADHKYHGGPDQAVYLYRSEDYGWWADELGRPLDPGTFGENVTVSGLPDDLAIGDRIAAGDVVLEVTAPRTPCGTLAKRMGDKLFVRAFWDAGRPGAYCRVIEAGPLQPGLDAALTRFAHGERVTLVDVFYALARVRSLEADRIGAFLQAPLAARVRAVLEKRLQATASA